MGLGLGLGLKFKGLKVGGVASRVAALRFEGIGMRVITGILGHSFQMPRPFSDLLRVATAPGFGGFRT